MTNTITINIQVEKPAPTLQQIFKFAHNHGLDCVFSEFDSVQRAFDIVCDALIGKSHDEVYRCIINALPDDVVLCKKDNLGCRGCFFYNKECPVDSNGYLYCTIENEYFAFIDTNREVVL